MNIKCDIYANKIIAFQNNQKIGEYEKNNLDFKYQQITGYNAYLDLTSELLFKYIKENKDKFFVQDENAVAQIDIQVTTDNEEKILFVPYGKISWERLKEMSQNKLYITISRFGQHIKELKELTI